jgi:hypothetical protein
MSTSIDYAAVKAARSPEYNRRIAAHESGHCYVGKAVGTLVDYVTIVPNGVFAGRCVRRGASSSSSLNFVDDSQPAPPPATTEELVSICKEIGPPKIGTRRIKFAKEIAHAQIMCLELVAGTVCERVMFPDCPVLSAEHDDIEARALASVVCAAPEAIDAFVRYAEAEAEELIRAHLGVVTALIDALVERGTLSGEAIDQVIAHAVVMEVAQVERVRRQSWEARVENASRFRPPPPCQLIA